MVNGAELDGRLSVFSAGDSESEEISSTRLNDTVDSVDVTRPKVAGPKLEVDSISTALVGSNDSDEFVPASADEGGRFSCGESDEFCAGVELIGITGIPAGQCLVFDVCNW